MRRGIFLFCMVLAFFIDHTIAEEPSTDIIDSEAETEKYVVPGAEDGYFSAEDYKNLKEKYNKGNKEYRTLIQTNRGRTMIRERVKEDGTRQIQILDTHPGRAPVIIIFPNKF